MLPKLCSYAYHLHPLVLLTNNGRHVGRAYLDFWCLFTEWMKKNMTHWCSSIQDLPKRRGAPPVALVGMQDVLMDGAQAQRILDIRGTIEYVIASLPRWCSTSCESQRASLKDARWHVQIHVRTVLQRGRHSFGYLSAWRHCCIASWRRALQGSTWSRCFRTFLDSALP